MPSFKLTNVTDLKLTNVTNDIYGALHTARSRASDLFQPTIRLGVTGLSRAGKTVFITSLIHNLIHGKRLPLFRARHEGRITKAYLQPQPDDDIPRFAYEKHLNDLVNERIWPASTRTISQLRLTIEYEKASRWGKHSSAKKLNLDIIDYPGEWLLDLPLLSQDFQTFSNNTLELAKSHPRAALSASWLELASNIDPDTPLDEVKIGQLAIEFSNYLRACRDDKYALSTLPPGRFLLPGDLDGSPAITFAPLMNIANKTARPGSVLATMQRRFESYKSKVIRPFYQNHFTRLDRQIILIDALQALNSGPAAIIDLERALGDILLSFKTGRNSFPGKLFSRHIDKILISATKADHLHHENHDRLQNIIRHLLTRARQSFELSGVDIDILAMSSVRATVEAIHKKGNEVLPFIIGTPERGETIGSEIFDGDTKTAIFPGDLPEKSDAISKIFTPRTKQSPSDLGHINFVRFRPPKFDHNDKSLHPDIPHIRLDRALEFLIGDMLR